VVISRSKMWWTSCRLCLPALGCEACASQLIAHGAVVLPKLSTDPPGLSNQRCRARPLGPHPRSFPSKVVNSARPPLIFHRGSTPGIRYALWKPHEHDQSYRKRTGAGASSSRSLSALIGYRPSHGPFLVPISEGYRSQNDGRGGALPSGIQTSRNPLPGQQSSGGYPSKGNGSTS
jgi:hypothetical protein